MSGEEIVGARPADDGIHASPLQNRLERYYQTHHAEGIVISELTAISDGWETEVYSFTATLFHQVEHLILRMYPGADAAAKCEREYQGMSFLQMLGRYPVPTVMDHVRDAAPLGKPFLIMQKIEGLPLGRVMQEQPARWRELTERFMQLFIQLHRIDCEPFLWTQAQEIRNDPSAFLRQKLAFGRALIVDQLRQTWAEPVIAWLEARMADISTPPLSVTHNDFHPWNILLTPDDKAYVIDWGNIEIGDYRYDLGWTLLLSATIGGGRPERDLFLGEYERLSGHPVEQIEYFEVVAALRRLFGIAVTLSVGGEAAGMRPETAAILSGRVNHIRSVYDLLRDHTGLRLPEIERLLDSLKG